MSTYKSPKDFDEDPDDNSLLSGSHYSNFGSRKLKKKRMKKNRKQALGATDSPSLVDKFNGMQTKGNQQNSLIKAGVDVLAGILIGPALSASLGKFAPLAGAALSFGGHYMGDQSGLMRGVAMSTLGHSVAKAKEYRDPSSTIQSRLSGLKDDILRFVFLKKEPSKQVDPVSTEPKEDSHESKPTDPGAEARATNGQQSAEGNGLADLGSVLSSNEAGPSYDFQSSEKPHKTELDLSELDAFDQLTDEMAREFAQSKGIAGPADMNDEELEEEDEGLGTDDLGYSHDDDDIIDFNKM